MKLMEEGQHILEAAEADFEKKHPMAEQKFKNKMEKMENYLEKRYTKDFMKWMMTKQVQAAKKHGDKVWDQELFHAIIKDAMILGGEIEHDVKMGLMGKKMNKDGSVDEWMNNAAARRIFEDLVDLLEAATAFEQSQFAKVQRNLEFRALDTKEFGIIAGKVMEDLDIHSEKDLVKHVESLMMEIAKKLHNCPHAKKLSALAMKMWALMSSPNFRTVSGMGSEKEWENWWNRKDFDHRFNRLERAEEEFEDDIDLLL